MNLQRIIIILLLSKSVLVFSQNFAIDQIGKNKLINLSGGVTASSIFYAGDAAREPFSYFLNGNINVNIAGLYSLPFSFSYTNQKLGFGNPVLMNRLSIHPSYKWITAHIGDASMSFSPFTLSGHQFTGFGVDLTPQGKFKISAMYGRLVRSNEYNSNLPDLVPAYKRYGYGFKTQYTLEKVTLGVSFFKAKDEINSITTPIPFELGISPKDNTSISFETTFKLFKKLQVQTDFATSSITEDTRLTDSGARKFNASLFLKPNSTTTHYNAYKAQLVYPTGKGTLGLGYERVDPNYRTLGGYFFNNDLENITVNATQTVFKDKINLSMNLGMQKDNLDKKKQSQMTRLVTAITADVKVNQKLNLNANYSNFQSYTNSRNQFDYINQTSNFDFIDTLNFRQVNQNAALTINYLLKNDKKLKQAFNANFSMQDALNQQQGKTIAGGASTYYNAAIAFNMGLPEKNLNLTASLNSTMGKLDTAKNLILGPTLAANKLFFDKKLNTSAAISYNTSRNNGIKQNDVFNFRVNGTYVYKEKHNFSLNAISLFNSTASGSKQDFTATLSYSYSFDKIKLKPAKKSEAKEKNDSIPSEPKLKIKYKSYAFEGTQTAITQQLDSLQNAEKFDDTTDFNALQAALDLAKKANNTKDFKNKALDYLEQYDLFAQKNKPAAPTQASEVKKTRTKNKTKNTANDEAKATQVTEGTIITLRKYLANVAPSYIEADRLATQYVKSHKMHGETNIKPEQQPSYKGYLRLVERSNRRAQKLAQLQWMQEEINTIKGETIEEWTTNTNFNAFYQSEKATIDQFIANKKSSLFIVNHLEKKMLAFYQALAEKQHPLLPTETK
ncbi:hypothetical protein [Flavobacterium sp.]|uniref:hypothetical protein n=1 Tax=Flavobacterium sp. TaxID=239 RepID=UPI002636DBAD|nr:hypothetical protein [Flavobacterium sp.]